MEASKIQGKHVTLEERIEEFNRLPEEEKGTAEPFDWGNDVGKEKEIF